MRLLKIIGYVAGAVIALLMIAALGIWLFVNPNNYKDRIIAEVRAATGRDLTLPGTIKLAVFPWAALELGPATLGNPAGFPDNQFVSLEHAALRVKLLPLLHGNLQIGRIEIDQLNVHLEKNAAGKGNWEDFGTHRESAQKSADAGEPGGSIFQSLAGITLRNSRLAFNALNITDLNLDIGNVAEKAAVPVKVQFTLNRGPDTAVLTVAADLLLSLDMNARQYSVSGLDIKGSAKSRSASPAVPFEFVAPSAAADLGAQTLQVPQFTAQFAAAKISGSVRGEQLLDKAALSGAVALEPVVLHSLLAQLGIELPTTRDPQALSRLSIKSDFAYGGNAVRLQNLVGQLDDSSLTGSIAVTDLDTKAATFTLSLDRIDIDRYRAPPAAAPATPVAGKPAQLPGSTLRSLDLQGSLVIGNAKFSGMTLTAVNVNVNAKDGLLKLAPLKAKMYGGQYSGDITYDVRGAIPQLQLNQQLTGIDVAPLLKDGFDSQRFSGHGNASTSLAGHGLDSDALIRSLNGRFEMSLADGAIEGADLPYAIGAAQALLKQQPMPAAANTGHTKFDALKMSAMVANGIATTNDLTVGTPYLRVTGQGTTNFSNNAIDLRLVATVLKAPPGSAATDLSALTLAQIPVTVTGTSKDPAVRPDLQGLIKSQLQQKAKDLINDKLKGFFGTH